MTKEEGERLIATYQEAQAKANEANAVAGDASPEVTAEAERLAVDADAAWDRMEAAIRAAYDEAQAE